MAQKFIQPSRKEIASASEEQVNDWIKAFPLIISYEQSLVLDALFDRLAELADEAGKSVKTQTIDFGSGLKVQIIGGDAN